MKIIKIFVLSLIYSVCITSCSEEELAGPDDKNSLTIEFDHYVGNEKLVLNSKTYKNVSGEEFSISTLNFFVSNISLKKSDGTEVKFSNQYYLVRQADVASLALKLENVPAGDYTGLEYTIGVDSLRSVADLTQRTGVLDPASYGTDNMYWSWNSGYIFFKIEGTSPLSSDPSGSYMYHVGGYGGYSGKTANNLRTVSLNFGTAKATVRSNVASTVHLITDVSQIFAEGLKIAATSMIHSPAAARPVADGYAKMFKVDHVHNDKRDNNE